MKIILIEEESSKEEMKRNDNQKNEMKEMKKWNNVGENNQPKYCGGYRKALPACKYEEMINASKMIMVQIINEGYKIIEIIFRLQSWHLVHRRNQKPTVIEMKSLQKMLPLQMIIDISSEIIRKIRCSCRAIRHVYDENRNKRLLRNERKWNK